MEGYFFHFAAIAKVSKDNYFNFMISCFYIYITCYEWWLKDSKIFIIKLSWNYCKLYTFLAKVHIIVLEKKKKKDSTTKSNWLYNFYVIRKSYQFKLSHRILTSQWIHCQSDKTRIWWKFIARKWEKMGKNSKAALLCRYYRQEFLKEFVVVIGVPSLALCCIWSKNSLQPK